MNLNDVLIQQRPGITTLLYSHDDSRTRYAVDLYDDGGYACRLNEVACFRRGTHDRMARLAGDDLNNRNCRTFGDQEVCYERVADDDRQFAWKRRMK